MYSVEDILQNDLEDDDGDLEQIIEGQAEDIEDDGEHMPKNDEEDKEDDKKEVKPKKKITRNPQPKLNVERLKGPRGLNCMEKLFAKIKFKGHGHEKEDLDRLMLMLHHWCHRLYPKYTFDDALDHIERLGTKKPLMTYKTKILMGLEQDELVSTETVHSDEENQDEVIDEFDKLLSDEIRNITGPTVIHEEEANLTEEQQEMILRNQRLAVERRKAKIEERARLEEKLLEESQQTEASPEEADGLTEEQMEMIIRNKTLAIEKQKARLEQRENSQQSQESVENEATI